MIAEPLDSPGVRSYLVRKLRHDNLLAVMAFNFGLFANMTAVSFVLLWVLSGPTPFRQSPPPTSVADMVLTLTLSSGVSTVCGSLAVVCGYRALRRWHAGTVSGGRPQAMIGVGMGTVGLLVNTIWTASTVVAFFHG